MKVKVEAELLVLLRHGYKEDVIYSHLSKRLEEVGISVFGLTGNSDSIIIELNRPGSASVYQRLNIGQALVLVGTTILVVDKSQI